MPDISTFSHRAPWHVVLYGTLLGSEVFQSFIGGIVAFRALPRPSFATLQTAIFPVYFGMQTGLPVLLALTFPGNLSSIGRKDMGYQGALHEKNRYSVLLPLAAMFLSGIVNWAFLGPATTRVMKERKHQETRDGRKAYDAPPHSKEMQRLNKRFGSLHGASTLVNLAGLAATVFYAGTLTEIL